MRKKAKQARSKKRRLKRKKRKTETQRKEDLNERKRERKKNEGTKSEPKRNKEVPWISRPQPVHCGQRLADHRHRTVTNDHIGPNSRPHHSQITVNAHTLCTHMTDLKHASAREVPPEDGVTGITSGKSHHVTTSQHPTYMRVS